MRRRWSWPCAHYPVLLTPPLHRLHRCLERSELLLGPETRTWHRWWREIIWSCLPGECSRAAGPLSAALTRRTAHARTRAAHCWARSFALASSASALSFSLRSSCVPTQMCEGCSARHLNDQLGNRKHSAASDHLTNVRGHETDTQRTGDGPPAGAARHPSPTCPLQRGRGWRIRS